VSDYRRDNVNRTGTLHATARLHPGRFSFQTTAGTDYNYSHLDGINSQGFGLAPGSTSITTASQQQNAQLWSEVVSLGVFGEEVVGVNDRLFLTGSLRYDGSTSFGDAYHPRPFPKIGVSWIASDEPFLKGIPGLDQLRFRYSFGASSRYPTSAMKLGTISPSQFNVNGLTGTIYARSLLANPLVRPERSRESEFGADATLFGRIDVGVTWYDRRTKDQLSVVGYPTGLGPQWNNVGDVASNGSEVTIVARLFETPSMRGTLRFTSSFDTNTLLTLGPVGMATGSVIDGYRIGYPLNSIFDRTVVGAVDTVGNTQDGVVFEREIVYSDSIAQYVGRLTPPRTSTLSPSLELLSGRLRLSALIDRSTGFVIPAIPVTGQSLATFVKGSSPLAQARALAGCCVYDPGDYTRWRELTVSTDLPQRLVHAVLLSRGTINFSVRNLALWTKTTAGDPESIPGQGTSAVQSVANNGTYLGIAQPRSWSISFDFVP